MHTEVPTSPARLQPARSPLLARLRVETAEYHAMLEAQLPLHETHLSRATYHELLLRFWGFYAPLERQLLSGPLQPHPSFDYRERLKAPKLEQDLYDGGETPDTLLRAPLCDDLPPVATLPQVLGCLYVVEGATLGGQIIARQLHNSLGSTPDLGARFFNGYGTATGSHWKSTGVFLTAMAEELDQDDAIVASANATFHALGRWVAAAPSPH
jgi:heme oxygenase (biliverdin-IX-beta and delta-forming)